MSEALPVKEPGRKKAVEFVMSKVEYARKRARKDMVWLLIAIGIFAAALGFSLLNLGTDRAVASGSCAKQCKAQFAICMDETSDRSSCQQQLLTCLDSCNDG